MEKEEISMPYGVNDAWLANKIEETVHTTRDMLEMLIVMLVAYAILSYLFYPLEWFFDIVVATICIFVGLLYDWWFHIRYYKSIGVW
ncbi:MAG: hypothetical protein HWN68_16525 [Desulfobacterales bacterium]|nr:hypothetical protein [Desulfobacterales bacterium]